MKWYKILIVIAVLAGESIHLGEINIGEINRDRHLFIIL